MSFLDRLPSIPKPHLPRPSLPSVHLPGIHLPSIDLPGTHHGKPNRAPMTPAQSQAYVQQLATRKSISESDAYVPTTPTTGNRMSVHTDRDAWRSMLTDLKGAKSSININEYQAVEGQMTKELADVLCAKAKAGVDVRMVIERASLTKTAKPSFDRMRAAGVKLVTNDTLNPRDQDGFEGHRSGGLLGGRLGRVGELLDGVAGAVTSDELAHPDHRKVWIIDGKTAYTGGLGIDDNFRNKTHDVMVRVQGPVVNQMQAEFFGTYKWRGGDVPADPKQLAKYFPKPEQYPDGMKMTSMTNIPGPEVHPITEKYAEQIDTAKKSLDVINPYIGEDVMMDKLADAAKRGVKVRLFVPVEPEHPLARGEQYNSYEKLLKAGVEIREYLPHDLHPKVLVADGQRAIVGSANLDGASMHRNLEHDLFVESPRAAQLFQKQLFGPDTAQSRRVTMEDARSHENSVKEWLRNRGADALTDLLSQF